MSLEVRRNASHINLSLFEVSITGSKLAPDRRAGLCCACKQRRVQNSRFWSINLVPGPTFLEESSYFRWKKSFHYPPVRNFDPGHLNEI